MLLYQTKILNRCNQIIIENAAKYQFVKHQQVTPVIEFRKCC